MILAIAQYNPVIGDIAGNIKKISRFVERARTAGASLAVFPELAVTGYPPRDLLCRPDFLRRVNRALEETVAPLGAELPLLLGAPVCGGAGCASGRPDAPLLYNAALLYAGGRLAGRQDKSLLPNYDVFDESRYFRPAAGRRPLEFAGVKLGVTICEDIWNDKGYWNRRLYEIDPVEELVAQGAELIVNISASPYHYGKIAQRLDMLRSIAVRHRVGIVYVNQVGGNDELIFDGSSVALDARGDVVALAGSFVEELVPVDVAALLAGGKISVFVPGVPRQTGSGGNDTASGGREGANPAGIPRAGHAEGLPGPALRGGGVPGEDIGCVYRALVLGIRDYLDKTGFKKALVGLSGGIDSSVTAALAAAALGAENVLGVSMPSRYSSPGSRSDARELAENLGIAYREVPIEGMFTAYLQALNGEGKPQGDLAEENIQARIRGNVLMFISNREGYLTLTTGNKSEMAVGYCTLYGDMCGGLAVLADVPKVMVYELARYINREKTVIPPDVLVKPPSAELRPDQKDQDTLPPYEILDAILHDYIEENKSVEEIAARGIDAALIAEIIRKIDRAEYKRRQAAPGLRVTSKAFGTGRRMPIAWRRG